MADDGRGLTAVRWQALLAGALAALAVLGSSGWMLWLVVIPFRFHLHTFVQVFSLAATTALPVAVGAALWSGLRVAVPAVSPAFVVQAARRVAALTGVWVGVALILLMIITFIQDYRSGHLAAGLVEHGAVHGGVIAWAALTGLAWRGIGRRR